MTTGPWCTPPMPLRALVVSSDTGRGNEPARARAKRRDRSEVPRSKRPAYCVPCVAPNQGNTVGMRQGPAHVHPVRRHRARSGGGLQLNDVCSSPHPHVSWTWSWSCLMVCFSFHPLLRQEVCIGILLSDPCVPPSCSRVAFEPGTWERSGGGWTVVWSPLRLQP